VRELPTPEPYARSVSEAGVTPPGWDSATSSRVDIRQHPTGVTVSFSLAGDDLTTYVAMARSDESRLTLLLRDPATTKIREALMLRIDRSPP